MPKHILWEKKKKKKKSIILSCAEFAHKVIHVIYVKAFFYPIIAIAVFFYTQVHLAEMHGAIGIIIFSDPADYTGGDIHQVYPRDWWLPPSGAQRGTVFIGDGDPLTPGYPAIGT